MKLPAFVRDFSLPPLVYQRQLRQWSAQMRESSSPIIWDEESACWLVFRYNDVARVQSDYHHFTSVGTVANKEAKSIIGMDPPDHTKLRSLITQAFSPRTILARASEIEEIVDDLLERVHPKGEMDWMTEFANPFPVMVIARILDQPLENWPLFKQWTDAIINGTGYREGRDNFIAYFMQVVEERSRHPKDDIISRLIEAEIDGERLSFGDIAEFCYSLLVGGNITTTNILGNALLCFDEHPAELERLRQYPELLESAVEEVLRYMTIFRAGPNGITLGRIAKTDIQFYDQLVREGEYMQVNRVSANFDERQFPDPERFDVARHPNRHQSFGQGVHFCIGAPLARLESKIALGTLLKKFQQIQIVHDQPLQQVPSMLIFGPQYLPITFQSA